MEDRESTLTTTEGFPGSRLNPIGSLGWLSGQEESPEATTNEPSITENFEHYVFEVLGASVDPELRATFSYRRHGEDTLAWGEPGEWIAVQWIRSLSQYRASLPSIVKRLWESYSSFQETLRSAQLYSLEQSYEVEDREQVRDFLREHPILIDFLKDSYHYLLKHFGNESTFILEVATYPESPDFQRLMVFIAAPLTVDEALKKLDAIDSEWYLDQAKNVGEFVNFNLALQ